MNRRAFLSATVGAAAAVIRASRAAPAEPEGRLDLAALHRGWRARLRSVAATGKVPLIDIESSYNPGDFDVPGYARRMDRLGVAMIALSPEIGPGGFAQGRLWHDGARRLLGALDLGPDRMNDLEDKVETLRKFLAALPKPAHRAVAYTAAWRLLFGEAIEV